MDRPTKVTLVVDGVSYTAVKRITVSYSANQVARTFASTLTDATDGLDDAWNFMPGSTISINANGQLVLTGHIEKMAPSFNATDHKVEISGRSKGGDTVDSAAEDKKGEFRDKTPLDIAKALDKQGVGFTSDVEQPKVEYHRINPNETVFQSVERIARRYQMLLQGMPDGSIKMTKGGTNGTNAALIEGVNILAASAQFDQSDQHSEYKVKGQRALGVRKKGDLQIVQTAKDKTVKRHRPKHIHQEGDIDDKSAKKRAEHHKNKQQGESVTATVTTQSWFDSGGRVWEANALVFVHSPKLKLSNQMLIKSVSLTQSESGSFAELSLVLPQAFGGEGTGMSGTGNTGAGTSSPWSF